MIMAQDVDAGVGATTTTSEKDTVDAAKGTEQTESKWWEQPTEWVNWLRGVVGPFSIKTDTVVFETDPETGVRITTAEGEKDTGKNGDTTEAGIAGFFKSIPIPVYVVGAGVLVLSALATRK